MSRSVRHTFTGRQVFGRGGLCERSLSGYEYRPEQERMMEAVADAIARDDVCLVEAGTGVGKTLAYLVPAIQSGRKTILATGTKALMEQVYQKDVPFLMQNLPFQFRVAVLKGRANYVCWSRIREQRDLLGAADCSPDRQTFLSIANWARRTETGDLSELDEVPEGDPVRHRVVSTPETCAGRGCADFARCFLFRARAEALESDLVITNHHLFFSDLAMREEGGTRILPRDAVVILDEAHALEGVATDHFGIAVRSATLAHLVADAQALAKRADPVRGRVLAEGSEKVPRRFHDLVATLVAMDGRAPIEPGRLPRDAVNVWNDLDAHLEVLADEAGALAQELDLSSDIPARAREIRGTLATILGDDDPSFVRVAERSKRSASLLALPVEVSGLLSERLFLSGGPVILVSATLSVARDTRFIRSRLGIPEGASEVILDSPYDFEQQVMLYLPDGMPDPNDPAFSEAFAREAYRVLEATDGRAFLLFTSHAALRKAYELMKERLRWPAQVQGEAPREALLDRFREAGNACLFGTHTFWEGVDVMGPALSCVIIDRLPFDPPDDPMLRARGDRVRASGGNPFQDLQLPMAVVRLRQGFGRLIRSRSDRGVVAILDPRIRSKAYGKTFLESLPPARRSSDLAELEAWCRENL